MTSGNRTDCKTFLYFTMCVLKLRCKRMLKTVDTNVTSKEFDWSPTAVRRSTSDFFFTLGQKDLRSTFGSAEKRVQWALILSQLLFVGKSLMALCPPSSAGLNRLYNSNTQNDMSHSYNDMNKRLWHQLFVFIHNRQLIGLVSVSTCSGIVKLSSFFWICLLWTFLQCWYLLVFPFKAN